MKAPRKKLSVLHLLNNLPNLMYRSVEVAIHNG